jgi:hypothetical protein
MKRWIIGLLCAAAALPAAGQELTLRALLEEAKANPGSKVFMEFEGGNFLGGTITEVGADVFCVAPPDNRWRGKDAVRCYPFAVVGGIERVNERNAGESLRLWMRVHENVVGN